MAESVRLVHTWMGFGIIRAVASQQGSSNSKEANQMQISKREFLKKLGLLGAAGATGAAFGDEFVATAKTLPPGSVGDPKNVWFGQRIFPIPHTIEDGPSCFRKDGKVMRPAAEIPVFHQADVVVVGGGPARLGVTPRRLDVKLLQKTLVEQGACLA